MKILIIGGTRIIGRSLIEVGLQNNHEITLFNRGKSSLETFENVEQIYGDRNFDLEKLKNRSWDAIVDTCGYLPQTVKASAEFLRDKVGQYVFISSISAYADFSRENFDETATLAELSETQKKEFAEINPQAEISAAILGEMYGALKVLCEKEVEKVFSEKTLNIRSGLIVGKFDYTDRFTYWVMRVAKGGKIIAPGNPNRFVQFIDAKNLAEFIINSIEQKTNGIFNVTGKPFDLTFGKMLDEIKSVSESDAEFVWVSEDFLQTENVAAWSEMPLYLPESDATTKGFLAANVEKSIAKGLKFRPLRETILETLNWRKTIKDELKAGISEARESELLVKYSQNN